MYIDTADFSDVYLLLVFSCSRSFRTDLPSISEGVSRPAISRMVGARSMFKTIWLFLQEAESPSRVSHLGSNAIVTIRFDFNVPGSTFHVWPPDKERDSDIKVVWHGLPLDQTKLPDVVTVVCGIDDVGVVQLAGVHECIVYLKI